jgi:hypothetical protein
MIKKFSLIILILFSLNYAACFSSWEGDKGTVNILIDGGNNSSRQAGWLNYYNTELFRHTITLEGPGQKQSRGDIKYGGSVNFSLMPGIWKITVLAEEIQQNGNRKLIAGGFESVVIKPGPNGNIIIPIQPVSDINITFEDIERNDPIIIIIKTSVPDTTRITISLDKDYDSIEWYCKGITGSGKYFILDYINNSYYNTEKKIYYLYITVEVWKEDIPYSNTIIIEIPEGE